MNTPLQSIKITLQERMRKLGVKEEDMEEHFSRSSGPGGQNVNKVSTAVTLVYKPQGIQITVQDSRSQMKNRLLARERLIEKIEKTREQKRLERQADKALERRRKAKRSRTTKKKMIEGKRRRGEVKKMRSKIDLAP